MDECKPLIGGDLRKAITLLQSAARLFGTTVITGKVRTCQTTQHHTTTAAIQPNITQPRPPFNPISRHYGRHSTQYHAIAVGGVPLWHHGHHREGGVT